MKCCLNCKNYLGDHCCRFNGRHVPHPLFQGGKKCECYQKPEKYVFEYPKAKDWLIDKEENK